MTDSLYALLENAAQKHGGRPAVEYGNESLTYAELLARSNAVADHLDRSGAGPGTRVAFCFRKSIDAIVSLFGIIRTGATYVPLDPSWPAERIATICQDANAQLWLGTDPPPQASVAARPVALTNPGESGAPAIAGLKRGSPRLPRNPADGLANILYTSGSTGRPKGVQITIRSLLHFSDWVVQYFELTPEDRVSNHAPFHFDLSTLDIFAAVRAGAAMLPVPDRMKMFPYQMAQFIAQRRISVWYSVPSALIMMQLRGRLLDHDFTNLRHVIFAGEVMPKPSLKTLARELPNATWTNLYGPTETNVCTYYRVTADDFASNEPVPIGRAISETRLWIREEPNGPGLPKEHPVHEAPSGHGELLVAGPTLTSGYVGDAELTSLRLIDAPDGRDKAYRTGDRVRLRSDGVLMFEGRIDRMIKCRGHRIEPGEIEAALARHPSVREAAVVPVADPVFGNRIKACLSLRDNAMLDEADLIAFCRGCLPSYMLPDIWSFHSALPRTDRGKVDLQVLTSACLTPTT